MMTAVCVPDDVDRRDADRRQKPVDDARVLQNGHPRVGADQEVHPHRNHDERHHCLLHLRLRARHDVRDRIARKKADQRRDHGELQRTKEDQKIGMNFRRRAVVADEIARGGEKAGDVLGGEVELIVRERVVRHEDKRHNHEQQRPDRIRREHGAVRPRRQFFPFVHSSSSAFGSDSSSSSLEKEE